MIILRIISILVDVVLAGFLFYKSERLKGIRLPYLILFLLVLGVHLVLASLFATTSWFLGVNLFANLLESYLVASCLGYRVRDVSFWILFQALLSLLAGAVLNQVVVFFLPLTVLSTHLPYLMGYVGLSWGISFIITFLLRMMFQRHHRLLAGDRGMGFSISVVPFLAIFFAFGMLAIQGQVFTSLYLPFLALVSLIVLAISSLYLSLHLFQQQAQFYQGRLEREQLDFQIRELRLQQADHEQLQRMRHDLRNSHLTILSLLQENPEQAKDYLLSLTQATEGKQTVYTKNPTLNFILHQKLQPVEQEVSLEVNCFVPEELGMAPEILAVILGNLLDNSIAASLRLPDPDQRFLSLNLRYFQGRLFLSLENAFDQAELESRRHRQTAGWGLKNVDQLVQESQGTIKQSIKDGRYRTEIILPI